MSARLFSAVLRCAAFPQRCDRVVRGRRSDELFPSRLNGALECGNGRLPVREGGFEERAQRRHLDAGVQMYARFMQFA